MKAKRQNARLARIGVFATLPIFMGSIFVVGVLGIVGVTLLFPTQARAHVPRTERVIDAIAAANVGGHRVRALRYRLRLHIGEGPSVATGDLVSHPTGLARLELRASGGLTERHLLLGDQHSATRNARPLVRPRAFLPPLFVLQSNSGVVLEAALETLGIDRKLMGLAPCGQFDCYVIGDPTRAVRRPRAGVAVDSHSDLVESVERTDSDPGSKGDNQELKIVFTEPAEEAGEEETELEDSDAAGTPTEYFASIWVDTVDFRVRQLESRDGVRIVLGPYVTFERLTVPQWWSIEEPGKRAVRFEVEGVIEVNAPAAAFSKTWLMAPVDGLDLEEPSAEPATPPESEAAAQRP